LHQGGDETILLGALDSLREQVVKRSKYAIQLGIDRREAIRLERIKS